MNKNVVIIGGGASALMLASLLPKNSVTIVESNAKVGAKILVSGGGRCNITNAIMSSEYFLADKKFVEPSLKLFNEKSLLLWLEREKLLPELRNGRQYFCKDSSKEIWNIFVKKSKKQRVLTNEKVLSVSKRDDIFYVKTNKQTLSADVVVVASGGLSFPKLGASSIGYEIAEHFGHSIAKTAPGLVGFTVQKDQFFFKELSGLSTNVSIKVGGAVCSGALLFAHKGISGPAILDASLYWEKGKIEIDFLPDFSLEQIHKSKKQLSSLLPMPKRLTKRFLLQLKLDDKAGEKVTADELLLLKTLQHYSFAPAGNFGYSKAEVTKGGVCTDEVDKKSMMSKKERGLYFTGEVLDVTGRLGGYNFQWAFSSAFSCAKSINKEER
jgi:predicted Rossmann fold flavoprotein